MKFHEFQNKIEAYPYFSTKELRLILGKRFNKTLLIQLKKWVDLQYLVKLKKGFYLLNRKDILENLDLAFLATKLYFPSYVSLEYALSFYGIIPEAVRVVTSITTKKTTKFTNNLGEFFYRHIKPKAFLGFELKKYKFLSYQIATPEKALVDYFYLNQKKFIPSSAFFDSMRFNLNKKFKLNKLNYYANFFDNKKLDNIILQFVKYARSKFH